MDDNFFSPEENIDMNDYYHESDVIKFEEKEEEKKEQKKETSGGFFTYGKISSMPVLEAVHGIKYDFNQGFRIYFPDNDKKYHLIFKDIDNNIELYNNEVLPGSNVYSIKKYYMKYSFSIYDENNNLIYEHEMNLNNKEVMVQMPVRTLGDSIAWFSYLERFQQKHNCKLIVVMNKNVRKIFEKQYPQFTYVEREDTINYKPYASYYLGLFFNGDKDNQPIDFKEVGLHKTAAMILGLYDEEENKDIPPRVDLSATRKIKEKYVVIATQASAQAKYWNNPFGWENVIKFLKENDYKVICIDQNRINGRGICFNHIPWGVEDYTGDLPLQERIDIIKDADFFIGLPSGLSWLAWCCKVPVVLISGFSLPKTEFFTPYRIINYNACCGCWDDVRENFEHNNFLWCPRKKDDDFDKKFECTKLITPDKVIKVIKMIPTFQETKKDSI